MIGVAIVSDWPVPRPLAARWYQELGVGRDVVRAKLDEPRRKPESSASVGEGGQTKRQQAVITVDGRLRQRVNVLVVRL